MQSRSRSRILTLGVLSILACFPLTVRAHHTTDHSGGSSNVPYIVGGVLGTATIGAVIMSLRSAKKSAARGAEIGANPTPNTPLDYCAMARQGPSHRSNGAAKCPTQ